MKEADMKLPIFSIFASKPCRAPGIPGSAYVLVSGYSHKVIITAALQSFIRVNPTALHYASQ